MIPDTKNLSSSPPPVNPTPTIPERQSDIQRLDETGFRLLIQGVKDYGIFMLNPKGFIISWNEGAQRIKGYTAEEIIGRHFSTFYPPEDIANDKPGYELVEAAKVGSFEDEGYRVRKDGTLFWANVIITAIRNEKGDLVGFAKVTRDLTERRAATEKAINDAKQLAEVESANRTKGQFLSAMSHELRTPLNAIGGYVDLLLLGIRGPLTDEQQADLNRIRRSQQHLLSVINDILNFSTIEAGQVIYDIKSVHISESLATIDTIILPQVQLKNLKYEQKPCPANAIALADKTKVEQIIINLLSNAIKFTEPTGSITVSCTISPDKVHISVKDTGTGIPQDQLASIFEPFVQVGRSLTNPSEGTGLGLAISRDLARAMKGDITVTSKAGEGTEFIVTLPRAQ
jgi:PAS domain S-box-containing protein